MTLTPLPFNQTHKTKTVKGIHKESALLVNGGKVKRAISKEKTIFAVLIVESAPDLDPISFHSSVQPLL